MQMYIHRRRIQADPRPETPRRYPISVVELHIRFGNGNRYGNKADIDPFRFRPFRFEHSSLCLTDTVISRDLFGWNLGPNYTDSSPLPSRCLWRPLLLDSPPPRADFNLAPIGKVAFRPHVWIPEWSSPRRQGGGGGARRSRRGEK